MKSANESRLTCDAHLRLARNYRRDLIRAIFAYSLGDRSSVVLSTIAFGKAAFDAAGWPVPRPTSVSAEAWPGELADIVKKVGVDRFPDGLKPAA